MTHTSYIIEMKNKVLAKIVQNAIEELDFAYGFCGSAVGDNDVMLNSSDGEGNDIKIIITVRPE